MSAVLPSPYPEEGATCPWIIRHLHSNSKTSVQRVCPLCCHFRRPDQAVAVIGPYPKLEARVTSIGAITRPGIFVLQWVCHDVRNHELLPVWTSSGLGGHIVLLRNPASPGQICTMQEIGLEEVGEDFRRGIRCLVDWVAAFAISWSCTCLSRALISRKKPKSAHIILQEPQEAMAVGQWMRERMTTWENEEKLRSDWKKDTENCGTNERKGLNFTWWFGLVSGNLGETSLKWD